MATTYKTFENQDIFDVVITTCGQIENLFDILDENPSLSLTSDPASGTPVSVKDGLKNNQKVVDYYKGLKFVVCNHNNTPYLLNENFTILQNEDGRNFQNEGG